MISQNGAASGFVATSLLQPAPQEIAVAAPSEPADGSIETVSVEAQQICRTIDQTITLADGTTNTERVTVCQGPEGWKVV